jgi:hypothetical protein
MLSPPSHAIINFFYHAWMQSYSGGSFSGPPSAVSYSVGFVKMLWFELLINCEREFYTLRKTYERIAYCQHWSRDEIGLQSESGKVSLRLSPRSSHPKKDYKSITSQEIFSFKHWRALLLWCMVLTSTYTESFFKLYLVLIPLGYFDLNGRLGNPSC